jgi:hypothetical protein
MEKSVKKAGFEPVLLKTTPSDKAAGPERQRTIGHEARAGLLR